MAGACWAVRVLQAGRFLCRTGSPGSFRSWIPVQAVSSSCVNRYSTQQSLAYLQGAVCQACCQQLARAVVGHCGHTHT
jgi:hypothetical protein